MNSQHRAFWRFTFPFAVALAILALSLLFATASATEPTIGTRYLITFDRPFWARVGDGYFLIEAAEGQFNTAKYWNPGQPGGELYREYRIPGHWETQLDGSFQATRVIDKSGTAYQCNTRLWPTPIARQELKP